MLPAAPAGPAEPAGAVTNDYEDRRNSLARRMAWALSNPEAALTIDPALVVGDKPQFRAPGSASMLGSEQPWGLIKTSQSISPIAGGRSLGRTWLSANYRWSSKSETNLLKFFITHSGVEYTIGRVNCQPFCQW